MNMKLPTAAFAALALFGCASVSPPSSTAGDYLSGRLAAGLNDIDAAADHYAAAVIENPDDIGILRNAFVFNLAAGRIEAAAPYARAIAANPEENGGLEQVVLGAIKLKRGDLVGARADFKGEFDETFSKAIAFDASAWIEAELAGPAAGIAAFDLGRDVFTGFNPTFKAILLEEKGDFDAARASHQLSIATFGGPVGRSAFGAFLERNGAPDEAREYYSLLEKDGGPARRMAARAFKRIDQGKPSTEYLDVTARQGTAIALYLFAGNVLQQSAEEMQRAEGAGFKVRERPFNLPLALAQLALYLDPGFADAQRLVGSIHNIYGNYAAARDAFAKISPASAQFEQAQIEIAGSLAAEDRTDEAIASLKAAIRRDPGANDALLTLSGLYSGEGRFEEAVTAATQAIDRLGEPAPEDAWRHFISRAAALIELDRFSDAEKDLKRAVELAPDEPIALNYLGYSWVERGLNLDEAFKMIEKAVALRPQSGAIIDSLGWAHYQRGDYEAALPNLERASALEPGDPTVTDHLGDVYWRLGRRAEARFQWERALELDPADKLRSALEEKLKSGLPDKKAAPEKS